MFGVLFMLSSFLSFRNFAILSHRGVSYSLIGNCLFLVLLTFPANVSHADCPNKAIRMIRFSLAVPSLVRMLATFLPCITAIDFPHRHRSYPNLQSAFRTRFISSTLASFASCLLRSIFFLLLAMRSHPLFFF